MAANRTVKVALEVKGDLARKEIRATRDDVAKLVASTETAGKSIDDMAADAKQAGRKLDDMAGEARQADRALDEVAAGADKAGRATDKLGAKVRISGRNFEDMKDELGRLDRQIDETVAHLKLLEHQFATTGDKTLLKRIRQDRSLIAQLQKIGKDLALSGGEVGGGSDGLGIGAALGALPAQLKGIAIIGLTAGVVASAPIIGAAVSGAVMGGVGVGGVIGGIVAATQDGRVHDAFAGLAAPLGEALKGIGGPFIGPLLHEMDTFAVTAFRAIDILHDGFAQLAPVIRPLALGLDGFVEALGPGLSHAFAAAKPALRVIANELPKIGDALSDAFDAISENGDGATMGLIAMLHAVEGLIRGGGALIGWLAGVFEWLVRTGTEFTDFGVKATDSLSFIEYIPGVGQVFGAYRAYIKGLNTETHSLIDGLDQAKDPTRDFARDLGDTATSADDAAQKVKDLAAAIDDLFGKQMNWDEAQIHVRQGMRDLIAELTHGKRTLQENTVEGDKNKEAILRQIGAIEDLRTAYYNQTGSLEGANAMYDTNLEKLRAELLHLGYDKTAVNNLIDAYKNIPAKATTTVEAPGLATAQSRLNKVENTLNRLDGNTYTTTLLIQELHREESRQYRRWGGVTEHAATGLLRDANIYSPAGPARYAFAEPATGGEAFIPKFGNDGRSMSILSQAASWYGASVVRGGQMAAPVIQVNVSAGTGAGELAQALVSTLRTEIKFLGGNVQSALGARA